MIEQTKSLDVPRPENVNVTAKSWVLRYLAFISCTNERYKMVKIYIYIYLLTLKTFPQIIAVFTILLNN